MNKLVGMSFALSSEGISFKPLGCFGVYNCLEKSFEKGDLICLECERSLVSSMREEINKEIKLCRGGE